jgi:hypothetical protein
VVKVIVAEDDGKGMVWCKCKQCGCTNLGDRDKVRNPNTWICGECVIKHEDD